MFYLFQLYLFNFSYIIVILPLIFSHIALKSICSYHLYYVFAIFRL